MCKIFNIYLEQLREGKQKKIEEVFDPSFLDIQEKEVLFDQPIDVFIVVYLAEQELIMQWSIHTQAKQVCRICNEFTPVIIEIKQVYTNESINNIKGGIFSYKEVLRELILLELPPLIECEGNCPRRKEYLSYLKK